MWKSRWTLAYCSVVFFFKQKTAYEMRISDWSSDVCSSDLADLRRKHRNAADDDCADDVVAKIDAPVVVPVSPRTGGRCDRGHEKRCGGGARQSAGHVRSEERPVGKKCGSTCSSRWASDR